jgi:hypothetical protein
MPSWFCLFSPALQLPHNRNHPSRTRGSNRERWSAIGRLVDGLRDKYTNDTELLEQGIVMIDALYRSFAADGGGRTSRGRAR